MNIFIISWTGQFENASIIAEAINLLGLKVTVIYSNQNNEDEVGSGSWVKVPDRYYFGMKFKKALEITNGNPMLIIQGDAIVSNWSSLIERAKAVTENNSIGVWAPNIGYTPYSNDLVTLHFDRKANISYVTQTDGVVFLLNSQVVKRLSGLEYEINNLGWGIDWIAICFSYVNNLFVLRDHNLFVAHPKGRGYNSKEAEIQMNDFLNVNMTMQEKLMYDVLTGLMKLMKINSYHHPKNT